MFAFDSSNNIVTDDFHREIDFANNLLDMLSVSSTATRVGALLYSDQIQTIFELGEYSEVGDMKSALNEVRRTAGGSRMDVAIRHIRTKSFRRRIARRDAAQVAILVTGSPAMYLQRSKRQASKARDAGIALIPVGIGDVNMDELRAISGTQDDTLQYPLPSFRDLDSIFAQIAIESCQGM